jgi:hypothetical protein
VDVDDGKFPRLVVTVEGLASNGTSLLPFKKGAFTSLLPIEIWYLEHTSSFVNPAFDCFPGAYLIILTLCNWRNSTATSILPQFVPNDYLYEKHKDKGTEKWEIYAWACRDIMARWGNLHKVDVGLSDKIAYEKSMGYNKGY